MPRKLQRRPEVILQELLGLRTKYDERPRIRNYILEIWPPDRGAHPDFGFHKKEFMRLLGRLEEEPLLNRISELSPADQEILKNAVEIVLPGICKESAASAEKTAQGHLSQPKAPTKLTTGNVAHALAEIRRGSGALYRTAGLLTLELCDSLKIPVEKKAREIIQSSVVGLS